ncbi:LacI family transcriptional regulator [Catenovulum sp. 2E275]|uniref:LacI family DNA-binding transcriptional regulator n=1 Tax=Catenovulum sp. 2E275 TaxID=2980497 RepID=UPI0021D22839|nr:LacI family DNA-binding transcriptional regulator [Catenovulum sp. 2E275]MCU4677352.1 LacI family transcriptional regulator [Catenovulum sp. 2E275]
MKITINDVANLAGVSIKTVSRVMNNESGVRQSTIDKVRVAATELNYQPSQAARNLASKRSYVVGYIYDNPNAHYVIDMQNGILQTCKNNHFELLIYPVNSKSPDFLEELSEMLKYSQISGVVLTPPLSEMLDVIRLLNTQKIKVVRILSGQKPPENISPCVLVNDKQAAFQITEHLILQGHTKIAFLCGDRAHSSTQQRLSGYLNALEQYKIRINLDWVIDGEYLFESGVLACEQILALEQRPTAVFACNDEIAAGALFAARLNGLDVPKNLAIAGFEDNPFSRQTWPKLTTAAQPTRQIASQAAELLLQTFKPNNKNENSINSIVFEPKLVVRESTSYSIIKNQFKTGQTKQ